MTKQDIEQFSYENNLDIRIIQPHHHRLMDIYGKYILDVYFKTKKGIVVKNSVLQWSTEDWYSINTLEELKNLL